MLIYVRSECLADDPTSCYRDQRFLKLYSFSFTVTDGFLFVKVISVCISTRAD